MKKIFTLIALMLLIVSGAQAQFTPTTFDAAGISQEKAYTISTVGRGAFSATATSIAPATLDATNTNFQFAFVTDPNDASKTYLYSVSQKKFLTDNGTWTSGNPTAINLFNVNGDFSNLGLSFSTDYKSKNLMINGGDKFEIGNWDQPDIGDKLLIQEVANSDYNLADAQEVLNGAVDVTYRVVDANGNVLISETVSQSNGDAAQAPADFANGYVTLSAPDHATVSAATPVITYTATVNLPYKPYDANDENTWYFLKIRGTKFVKYSETAPYQLLDETNPNLTLTDDDKWAFTGNPYKVEVLNHKAGDAKRMNYTAANPVLGDPDATGTTSYWVLVKSPNNNADGKGFLLKPYAANTYLNDNNNQLKYWGDVNDPGSKMVVYGFEEAKVSAKDIVSNFPALFTDAEKTTANNAIDQANDYGAVRTALTSFFQNADGKRVTIHTGKTDQRGANLAGYISNKDGNLVINAGYTYDAEFEVSYKASTATDYNLGSTYGNAFTFKNVVNGNYIQDVKQSTDVMFGAQPKYFGIVPQNNGDVAIGQGTIHSYLHHADGGRIVGWTSDDANSHWTLALYDNSKVDTKALLADINNLVVENGADARWGEARPNDAFTTARSTFEANPTYENYKAALDARAALPSVGGEGFYNIANTEKTGYSIGLTDGNESKSVHAQTTDNNDANQLWLVEGSTIGKVRLYNANAQKYLGVLGHGSANTTPLSDDPVDYLIAWNNDGTFTLNEGGSNQAQTYLRIETNGNLNAWTDNKNWKATKVSSLTVTSHTVGDKTYVTIAYPFSVTLDKGEGYKASLDEEKSQLNLTSLDKTINAGEPAIVIADAAEDANNTITLTINGTSVEANASADNQLKAQLLPLSLSNSENVYTLGQSDGKVGFYLWDGTLKNKAYVSTTATAAAAKGFTFNFGTVTGINGVKSNTSADADAPRYNIAGQRVDKAYKGIVIVNGKKLILK